MIPDVNFDNTTAILSRYPDRKILLSVKDKEQFLARMLISFIFRALQKVEEFISLNDLKVDLKPNQILNCLKNSYEHNNSTPEKITKFFKYVMGETALPIVKKDETYETMKKFVLQDKKISIYNNTAISTSNIIYDLPFGLIELIVDSFYILNFN